VYDDNDRHGREAPQPPIRRLRVARENRPLIANQLDWRAKLQRPE
jgi:hypothetical protein